MYFRPEGDEFYSFVDMTFGGLRYCGTLPPPRAGKLRRVEYYVQGVDDEYNAQRTTSYWVAIQPEGACDFPPVETDATLTSSDRGLRDAQEAGQEAPRRLPSAGVSFVPVQTK